MARVAAATGSRGSRLECRAAVAPTRYGRLGDRWTARSGVVVSARCLRPYQGVSESGCPPTSETGSGGTRSKGVRSTVPSMCPPSAPTPTGRGAPTSPSEEGTLQEPRTDRSCTFSGASGRPGLTAPVQEQETDASRSDGELGGGSQPRPSDLGVVYPGGEGPNHVVRNFSGRAGRGGELADGGGFCGSRSAGPAITHRHEDHQP